MSMTMHQRDRTKSIVRSVLMIVFTLVMAIPLYYILVSTFKTQAEMAASPLGLPQSWSLSNYVDVFKSLPIMRSFANTLIVTVVAVAFQVLIGSLAAYGMILNKATFTSAVGAILILTFCIPTQSTLIPIYQMSASIGLVNTLQGLIIIYMGSAVFCYFLIVGYMRQLPKELFEAARIDGASPFRIYWQIVLPLIRPILTTVIVFQTLATWNDFMWPNIFLSSSENRTIVLQVYNAVSQFTTDWPSFMTTTVIALLPVFIFFIFCQRWIVSGLVSGSVKG